ncbi:S-adenosyl-L-methionine-dependent methyltransferase [Trinorchestia longiramus]|nr:S-adenosyl-L-methionine-dependent methyltransferase [Trinorchestia longiramus]
MGGAVSVSYNNDDMVTKLINAQYIKTPCVERAFRAVDRGNYVLHKDSAYSDSAWRTDHLHLSAPCIYAQVLEGLLLEPGQRFLNIGSGTGYLSTMVAMILGSEGTNHGVELRPEVIRYAHLRMKFFKKCSSYNPDFFADPVFIEGNAYHLMPPETKYDRIYCGAAVEPAFLDRLRDDFLNVGGVIVAPVQDELLQVYKEDVRRDIVISLLDVSFSHLIRRTSSNARHIEQQPPNSVVLREYMRANKSH